MNYVSNFSETLSELMSEKNLTTRELSKAIDISYGNIGMWTTGSCKLTLASALKLADYFDCSLEFLMGRTDTRIDYKPQPCPPFHARLLQVMKEQGKTQYRVMKDTSFSSGSFSQWKNGSIPLMESVIGLAGYLNCTLDYLVGREN